MCIIHLTEIVQDIIEVVKKYQNKTAEKLLIADSARL